MMTYRLDWNPTSGTPARAVELELAELRAQIGPAMRKALASGSSDVHLFQGPVGSGKTRQAVTELSGPSEGRRATVFLPTQEIAKGEWEDRLQPGSAVRLMSLDRMREEGVFACHHQEDVAKARRLGQPWFRKVCLGRCHRAGGCPYNENRRKAKTARIVLAQHAHLPMAGRMGLLSDRAVIIDEAAVTNLWSRIEFSEETISSYRGLLSEFGGQAAGGWERFLEGMRDAVDRIAGIPPGESRLILDDGLGDEAPRFQRALDEWLVASDHEGRNLTRDVLAAMGGPVRCSAGKDGAPRWWATRPSLPRDSGPVIILDATGSRALYETALPGRKINVWPESGVLKPASDVTVFCDGAYPQGSLWSAGERKPTRTFEGICDHVDAILRRHGASFADVGFVTLKKLLPALRDRFPGVPAGHLLHYGDLRGRNDVKDCRLVFVIGCQPPELTEVARTAVRAFGLDCDPGTLVGDLESQRKFSRLDAAGGDGPAHEVRHFEFDNKYMKLAWELCVTAEVIQAVGRARVYEQRPWLQRVFVFTNVPTGLPATRVLTRREHLRELGEVPRSRTERVAGVMETLARERAEFGYEEIAAMLGVKESSLRAVRYQQAIKRAMEELGLAFEQRGDGRPGVFVRRAA